MPTRNEALYPTPKLRAHRPRTDALQPPPGDLQEDVYTDDVSKRQSLLAAHWHHLLAGAALFLGFYLLLSRIILPFIVDTTAHWDYGAARISHYDLDVGHGGTSHFITEYYRNQAIVIEMPLHDPGHSHIYALAESLAGNDSQRVVSLTPAYVSHSAVRGKPDLLVSVSGSAIPRVLYNTGNGFRTEVNS
jgi:hypothetical protein